AFLAKFNSTGGLVWGTYYGGLSDEFAASLATDANGSVYLGGSGGSATGIASPGAHQQTLGNIPTSGLTAFLAKFNASGVRQWGTYYGGESDMGDIYIDEQGNVHICGRNRYDDHLVVTPDGLRTMPALAPDAFYSILSPSGRL